MVEYNKINTKLSNLQLSKLKTATKNNEGTTLRLSAKNFNNEQLPHELFLTTRQTTKLGNKIINNMSADIKLSKAQIKNIIMSGTGLGSILGRLLPKLVKPALSIGKNILAPLGLSAAMSDADAGIQRKTHGYGSKSGTTVKFSNDEINDMINISKALENSDVLMKGVTETFKNDIKKVVLYQFYQCYLVLWDHLQLIIY